MKTETKEEIVAREEAEFPVVKQFCDERGYEIDMWTRSVYFDTEEQSNIFIKTLKDMHNIDIPSAFRLQAGFYAGKWTTCV